MKFTHSAEGLTILPVILFTPHIYGPSFNSQMFDEFSHDNIVRVRLNVKINTNTLKCYSSYEPARGLLSDECQSHCFTERWFELYIIEARVKRRLLKKNVWIFLGLSVSENPDKTRPTSSSFSDPFASLGWWPLFGLFSGASSYFPLAFLR